MLFHFCKTPLFNLVFGNFVGLDHIHPIPSQSRSACRIFSWTTPTSSCFVPGSSGPDPSDTIWVGVFGTPWRGWNWNSLVNYDNLSRSITRYYFCDSILFWMKRVVDCLLKRVVITSITQKRLPWRKVIWERPWWCQRFSSGRTWASAITTFPWGHDCSPAFVWSLLRRSTVGSPFLGADLVFFKWEQNRAPVFTLEGGKGYMYIINIIYIYIYI